MKGSPQEASRFSKSGAQVWMPRPKARTIADRLSKLIVEQHVSTRWIQFELAKLIPALRKQEAEKYAWGLGGFGAGLAILLLVLLGQAL